MSAMKNLANEIRLLEKGERLEKMSSSSKFKKRFFKLDLDKMQLTASTKRCGKLQKECKIFKIRASISNVYSQLSSGDYYCLLRQKSFASQTL